MNTTHTPGMHSRFEPRAWHLAAAALFAGLVAWSSPSAAEDEILLAARDKPRAAKVTPVAAAPAAAAAARPASSVETLGPGDNVRVTVFRNPDLTTETRVSEQGTISFPMIGDVPVSGLTAAQLGSRIAERLKKGGFVVNPEVNVSVAQVNSRQVSILGNVNKPGRYPLDVSTARLMDVLALAGGIAPTGSDQVTLVRNRNGKTTKTDINLPAMIRGGDLGKNVELAPGDTVFVHRAPMVYVYGEVQKAGAYRIEPNMTVMQAIAMGGGLTPRGTERGVRIHRKNGDGSVKQINARLTDEVQVDDVIYVRESLF